MLYTRIYANLSLLFCEKNFVAEKTPRGQIFASGTSTFERDISLYKCRKMCYVHRYLIMCYCVWERWRPETRYWVEQCDRFLYRHPLNIDCILVGIFTLDIDALWRRLQIAEFGTLWCIQWNKFYTIFINLIKCNIIYKLKFLYYNK